MVVDSAWLRERVLRTGRPRTMRAVAGFLLLLVAGGQAGCVVGSVVGAAGRVTAAGVKATGHVVGETVEATGKVAAGAVGARNAKEPRSRESKD